MRTIENARYQDMYRQGSNDTTSTISLAELQGPGLEPAMGVGDISIGVADYDSFTFGSRHYQLS
jgi:hypothetical protein